MTKKNSGVVNKKQHQKDKLESLGIVVWNFNRVIGGHLF
jgi:hypothetical protein